MYEEIIYSLKKTNSDKSRLCEKKEKKRILRPEEEAFEKLHKHYLLSYKPNKLSSFNIIIAWIYLLISCSFFPIWKEEFKEKNKDVIYQSRLVYSEEKTMPWAVLKTLGAVFSYTDLQCSKYHSYVSMKILMQFWAAVNTGKIKCLKLEILQRMHGIINVFVPTHKLSVCANILVFGLERLLSQVQ